MNTYVDGQCALLVNKGRFVQSAPGEERNAQIRDVLYPAGSLGTNFG